MSPRETLVLRRQSAQNGGMDLDLVGTKQPDEVTLKVDPSFDLNMQA